MKSVPGATSCSALQHPQKMAPAASSSRAISASATCRSPVPTSHRISEGFYIRPAEAFRI